MNVVDYLCCLQDTVFTLPSIRSTLHSLILDVRKTVRAGGPAFNGDVVELDGVTRWRLLDFQRGSRPLVVVFGSCT